MKIRLINPPNPYALEPAMNPPLGLAYIAGYLQSCGYEDVKTVDFNLVNGVDFYHETSYLKRLPLDADVYGIYCMTPQYRWFSEIAQYLQQNSSGVVVAGGPHPTNLPYACLDLVDTVVAGDGEIPMVQICNRVSKGLPGSVSGVWSGDGDLTLDSLPFPDRETAGPLEQYQRTLLGRKAIHIVTLRGCPFNCAFCDRHSVGRKVRYRSVANVLAEIDWLREKYDWADSFVIYDDIFTLLKLRVQQFCEEFKKRGLKWRCWSRADLLDRNTLKLMRDSGLTSITLGVESGDDGLLRRIGKKTSFEINKKALLLCKELGVPVRCSLMFGNPGETMDSVENTLRLIEETQPDEWNLATLAPIPGSPIWDDPEYYGMVFDKVWLREQKYEPCNRFGDTGVGTIWARPNTLTPNAYRTILKWFISELERICPRNNIQDTIQEIHNENISV